MILLPYDKNRKYDIGLSKVLHSVTNVLDNKDDDFLILCTGDTGTGKTTLMFHAYEEYAGIANVSVEQVALTRQDFASALKYTTEHKLHRFVGYDEANISKRDALTKWNKAIIDLYYSIRGLKIFHWWNNPSLDMIDKPFIEERVKGVIFIFTKDVKRPRLYLYFTKNGILNLLEKHGNLKHRTLKKYGEKYAWYRGWFKAYNGVLLESYKSKKQDRMEQKVDDFYKEFALDNNATLHGIARSIGISENTAKKYYLLGVETKQLKEGEDFILNGMNKPRFTTKGRENLLFLIQNPQKQGTGAVLSLKRESIY